MGQQQLLLIVLGVIIVGIAVVVGINLFGSSARQSNENAIMQDCLSIISSAQQWVRKPQVLGGPAVQNDLTLGASPAFNFTTIGKTSGLSNGNLTWTNPNGDVYTLSAGGVNTCTITATGKEGPTAVYVFTASSVGNPTVTH